MGSLPLHLILLELNQAKGDGKFGLVQSIRRWLIGCRPNVLERRHVELTPSKKGHGFRPANRTLLLDIGDGKQTVKVRLKSMKKEYHMERMRQSVSLLLVCIDRSHKCAFSQRHE